MLVRTFFTVASALLVACSPAAPQGMSGRDGEVEYGDAAPDREASAPHSGGVRPDRPYTPPPWEASEMPDGVRTVDVPLVSVLPGLEGLSRGGEGWVLASGPPEDLKGFEGDGACDTEVDVLVKGATVEAWQRTAVFETGASYTVLFLQVFRYEDPRIVDFQLGRVYSVEEQGCLVGRIASAFGGTLTDHAPGPLGGADARVKGSGGGWSVVGDMLVAGVPSQLLLANGCTGVGDMLGCAILLEIDGYAGWSSEEGDYVAPLMAMRARMIEGLGGS